MDFCHITPTAYLDLFASSRSHHLVLAHLIEQDEAYRNWYYELALDTSQKRTIIMDNSAFEMYKQGRPMYPTDKLIDMAFKVNANYIVMSDYPGEPAEKTIQAAIDMWKDIKDAGFGTFFVPQSEIGDEEGLISCFDWAAQNREIVDYVGVSILSAPNAYKVEKDNKLQRFLSRWHLMRKLEDRGILSKMYMKDHRIHFLGMVDGPNEIALVKKYLKQINTWDSSAAVWAGLHNILFDNSPTGLIDGKFEQEVDFDHKNADGYQLGNAMKNINYIDALVRKNYGK